MALPAGTKLGAYEILGPLGAGGMGEVYNAHDARLERTVAVKILPAHVASDPVLKQRFEREARALAALSHPHICQIFDVGHASLEQGEIDFLVMEHLEGETLAKRLGKGALPFNQALAYGIDLADALENAHRKGVVHRDLKPGNVMMTPAGAKLVDFGLARRTATAPAGATNLTAAPTAASPLTGAGSIVGTFQYMAPEQLEGQEADARADIFAFGALLYEMLTGQKAFQGKTQASLIGSILRDDPRPVSALLPTSPPSLDQIVKTCLAKDPNDRWQTAGDVGRQLKWILEGGSQPSASTASPAAPGLRVRRVWALVAIAAIGVVAAIALGLWAMRRTPAAPAEVTRLLLAPSANAPLVNVGGIDAIISPDGKRIVYLAAKPDGGSALYVRELNELEPRIIQGTDLPPRYGVANPFFMRDGAAIVFGSPRTGITKVGLNGGPPIKIADEFQRFLNGGEGPDNTVLLGLGDGVYRTPAAGGGSLERLTPPENPRTMFAGPKLVRGTKLVLFHKTTVPDGTSQIVLLDLDTREQKVLVDGGMEGHYLPSGHIVFARGTTLMAVPFDVVGRRVTSAPVAVIEGIQHPSPIFAPDFSVSDNGTLIYLQAPASVPAPAVTPVWVDRSGRELGPALKTPIANLASLQLSPDGGRVVVSMISGPLSGTVWVYELTGRPPVPLIEKDVSFAPLWFKDGTRIAFATIRSGQQSVYSMPADGSALEPQLLETGLPPIAAGIPWLFPNAWLADGRLVFSTSPISSDILAAAPLGASAPQALVKTEFSEDSARVSPDGQWIAFRWDRTGRREIWIRAVSGGAPVRVSQNGGDQPLWSRDGRELFFREGTKVMSAAFRAAAAPSVDQPIQLFDRPYRAEGFGGAAYDVASDGRFIMIPQSGAPPPAPGSIVVVQNWIEELKRLVPNH